MRSRLQTLASAVHGRRIGAFQRLLGVRQRVLDIRPFLAGDLVAVLAQHLLDAVDHAVKLVAGLDFVALGLVFGSVRVGVLRHALDLFLAQT